MFHSQQFCQFGPFLCHIGPTNYTSCHIGHCHTKINSTSIHKQTIKSSLTYNLFCSIKLQGDKSHRTIQVARDVQVTIQVARDVQVTIQVAMDIVALNCFSTRRF